MKKELLEWIKSIIFAGVFVFALQLFFIPTTIYHQSMAQTLQEKDMVIIQKTKNIEIGDIVVFKSREKFSERDIEELPFYRKIFVSQETEKKLIKRVIAGPGDKLEIVGSEVYLNDVLLDEPFINNDGYNNDYYESIPKDYYFVMGDNRQYSKDSRSPDIGLIHIDDIVGKTNFRIFPFSRFGKINEF